MVVRLKPRKIEFDKVGQDLKKILSLKTLVDVCMVGARKMHPDFSQGKVILIIGVLPFFQASRGLEGFLENSARI